MKKLLILSGILMLLTGCGSAKVESIDCNKKDELMNDGAVLIDVRTPAEFHQSHLDEAINLSSENIATTISKVVEDKETKIIVYCRSGNRSAASAQTLIDLGYTQVYDLGAMDSCKK